MYQRKSKYHHSKSHRWHPDKRESEYRYLRNKKKFFTVRKFFNLKQKEYKFISQREGSYRAIYFIKSPGGITDHLLVMNL